MLLTKKGNQREYDDDTKQDIHRHAHLKPQQIVYKSNEPWPDHSSQPAACKEHAKHGSGTLCGDPGDYRSGGRKDDRKAEPRKCQHDCYGRRPKYPQ